jgi:hypothetical protein
MLEPKGSMCKPQKFFADEGIARISARWNSGQGEARGNFRWQILERVHGEVDATCGKSFFDFLDEDAGAVGRKAFSSSDGGILQAVTGSANDFNLNGVAVGAELGGDMVGLPERELRAARSNANGKCAHTIKNTVCALLSLWRAERPAEVPQ